MTHPRDHILALAAQLRSDMTTLANVTCSVRVNGGSATIYSSSAGSPRITQYADITYGYELKIPASTYADGDVVEVTWLYSATPYAIDSQTIGPANTGDAYARLGAPAGASVSADVAAVKGDTAAVKTDVETSGVVVAAASKTGYALTAGEHTNIAADTQTGLTAQGYTTTRASYLDTLNGLVQAIWDKATSALTTVGSIGKLLATNIDARISSSTRPPRSED